MRKTKIICTLGPSSNTADMIQKLILAGMDAARFNFSHGDHMSHKLVFDTLVQVREELNRPIPAILDTRGPEVRIKTFESGKVTLVPDQSFMLTGRDVQGDETMVSVTYEGFARDLRAGGRVLIDDGLIELEVERISGDDIHCRVINGGVVSDRKGINVPGTSLSLPYLNDRDRADIVFGIQTGFDFIAASFVRCADDVLQIRRILDEHNCHSINIISKIENPQGVENIDDIIRVSDGIMVARGDMGVEIPLEDVPVLQKMIIKKVYNAGKQVVTATQMLDSMMKNPRPTRAEATDVANAIYDGTSAIMLSGETASGLYPVEAVRTMARIAEKTESDIDYIKRFKTQGFNVHSDVTNAISHATCTTAHDLGAAAILTVSKSGRTVRMISKYRPNCPIVGCTTSDEVCRQINLSWGVVPLLLEEQNTADSLFENAVDTAQKAGIVTDGELVVITAGVPLGISGTTNLMKVQVVGHVLVSGKGVSTGASVCANLCVCNTEEEALVNFKEGDILVIPQTSNTLLPILKKASGIVTELPGQNSHAAIVGLSLDIPVIVGAQNATRILKSGTVVSIDATRGIVSCN